MKNFFAGLSASLVIVTAVGSAALAGPSPAPKMAAKTMTCPACKMAMPMVKSAKFPVAVPIKGKGTFYCCSGCAASKAMQATAKKTMAPAKMAPAKP